MNYEYYNKYLKYKNKYLTLKIKYFGGSSEEEFELYEITKQKGGLAKNVWPTISHMWEKYNKRMGIRSKKNKDTDYIILNNNIDDIFEPMLGRGGTSVVYEVIDSNPKGDNIYILKISEKIGEHILHNSKVIEENTIFKKYMMKIYKFGTLNINDNDYKYNEHKTNFFKDTYVINKEKTKDFIFDINIVKKYNTVNLDLTNQEKLTFLYNNILMLKYFEEKGYFHADYKLDNIGYDSLNDIILIDYDEETLQTFSNKNPSLILDEDENIKEINIKSRSYTPEYITKSEKIHYSKFNKFSVGGLAEIIWALKIKFIKNPIEIPDKLSIKTTRKITSLTDEILYNDLHLTSIDYDLIPTYSEILEILDWLKEYVEE